MQVPLGVDQLDLQGHLAERVRGAGQAGVKGADRDLDVVQKPFGELAPVQITASPRA